MPGGYAVGERWLISVDHWFMAVVSVRADPNRRILGVGNGRGGATVRFLPFWAACMAALETHPRLTILSALQKENMPYLNVVQKIEL